MNLGESIYNYRTKKNLSQGDVANALDVSRQSVSKWENNTAVPELDKLVRLAELFDISTDELILGKKSAPESQSPPSPPRASEVYSIRITIGLILLAFGLISLLLSVFWGDNLKFGEALGEVISVSVLLVSVSLIATYSLKTLSFCAVIYLLYSVVCFGLLNMTNIYNYVFVFLLGSVILVWFIVLGLHENSLSKSEK